jgi:hypothetical protein
VHLLGPQFAVGCTGGPWEYQGGTIVYTAPELILAARTNPVSNAPRCYASYGPAVDCWAYGLVAFKLLTGYNLFRLVADAVPPETDQGMDDNHMAWHTQNMADLHVEWVRASPDRFHEVPTVPWISSCAVPEMVTNPHVCVASCPQKVWEMYLGVWDVKPKIGGRGHHCWEDGRLGSVTDAMVRSG